MFFFFNQGNCLPQTDQLFFFLARLDIYPVEKCPSWLAPTSIPTLPGARLLRPALYSFVLAAALLGLLTLALNLPPGHCIGQQTHSKYRPCPECQVVPTTERIWFPQPSGCSVPHTLPSLTPAFTASAEARKGDSGGDLGLCRRGLLPQAHFQPHFSILPPLTSSSSTSPLACHSLQEAHFQSREFPSLDWHNNCSLS